MMVVSKLKVVSKVDSLVFVQMSQIEIKVRVIRLERSAADQSLPNRELPALGKAKGNSASFLRRKT